MKDSSSLRLPKSLLLPLIILSLASMVFSMAIINCAVAHDPSEEDSGTGMHHHQLPPPWPYHLAFVSLGGIFLIGGAFTARYLKRRKGWVILHRNLALMGVASALAGISVAVYMVTKYMETYFVKEAHTYLGASVFAFVIITPMLGFAQLKLGDKRVRIIHRWFGRVAIILILAAVFAGIEMVSAVLKG